MVDKKRIGVYAWAGPGTVRLLQTKYFNPKVDIDSFLFAYNLPYLSELKKKFSVTDAWVTYSWGFSDQTEQEEYQFLRERIKNFKQLRIRTHAYVQGLNLVTDHWNDIDPWCRDPWGRKIPYSRGRSFTCPNNPIARQVITDRILRACKEKVDGIYVDNILFGFPPYTVSSNLLPWFGCSCRYCQIAFRDRFNYSLPIHEISGRSIQDYLQFRMQTITHLIRDLSVLAHAHNKEFGINLYDPSVRLDTLYYGYSLPKINEYLDYFMIENHSLPRGGVNNTHLKPLIEGTRKPVFVTSYKKGIGYESQFTQSEIDSVFAESTAFHYSPCLKVTEFTTRGVWHMLHTMDLHPPRLAQVSLLKRIWQHQARESTFLQKMMIGVLSKPILTLLYMSQTNRFFSGVIAMSGIHQKQVQLPRFTTL